MSRVIICDKCGKKTTETDGWTGGKTYNMTGTKMSILKQKVKVGVVISLECGDPLDLCDKCGWKILDKFTK